jgi:hypothetical protein
MPDEQTLTRWRVPLDRGRDLFPSPARESEPPPPTPLLRKGQVVREKAKPVRPRPAPGAKFTAHPRYAAWLARCGITSADTALSLSGEVVSGHTDRHVVRVELRSGASVRAAYLKREHVAGMKWRAKNWAAGFGWVSRCEREAVTLSALEAAGLPGPQWLAHGRDADGRAFLLVDELAGAVDLLTLLRDRQAGEKSFLAERVGTALAELHTAGFGTPDLAAKHLMVSDDEAVTVIDWPSAAKRGHVRYADVIRWLGTLHAGIAPQLAMRRDRLRVLWAYRRACRRLGKPVPDRFGYMAKAVDAAGTRRELRPSVRAQRQNAGDPQRLVWVAGEAVVAIPSVAADWPSPAEAAPFYPTSPSPTPTHGHRERVILPNGLSAVLVRFHTIDPLGRLVASVRERTWRSPAAVASRVLFHLQRHAIPSPRLLAFGQRMQSKIAAESFLCAEMPAGVSSLAAFLACPDVTPSHRASVLAECGRLLRQLHDAGLRAVEGTSMNDPLFVVGDDTAMSVSVGSPFAVRVVRKLTQAQRRADLKRFLRPLDRTSGGWVTGGYRGANG